MTNKVCLFFTAFFIICNNYSCSNKSNSPANNVATAVDDDSTLSNLPVISPTIDTLIFPDNEKQIVSVLQTGKYDVAEIDKPKLINKKWTGLFKIGTLYFIRPTAIEITNTNDTIENKIQPVLMVNTSLFNRCVILISGLDLNAKDLQTAQRNKDTILPGEIIDIKFKENLYSLKAEGEIRNNNDGTFEVYGYRLFLSSNKDGNVISQLLVAQPVLKNSMISVLWTGDLDGDNKLDLIINASPSKGKSTPALYLSSKSEPDELVKFVGQHIAK